VAATWRASTNLRINERLTLYREERAVRSDHYDDSSGRRAGRPVADDTSCVKVRAPHDEPFADAKEHSARFHLIMCKWSKVW